MPLTWIDPFSPAKTEPPRRLAAFFRWALKGSGPALGVAGVLSIFAGVIEVMAALVLGWVVDAALAAEAGAVFSDHTGLLLAGLAFFLLLRPALFGVSSYMQSIVVAPNVFNLVLSRLHRYTLGQAVTFFDNDFAGRISQKEMQTSRALTDVVTEVLHTVLFAAASFVGAVMLLGTVDWRIAAGLVLWMVGYVFLIRHFMPRVRKHSKARAGARAMVTGQVVDTITNIKTVKLFAHADHEDRAALGAMRKFLDTSLDFGRVSVSFRFWLMTIAGFLPVLLVGGAIRVADYAFPGTDELGANACRALVERKAALLRNHGMVAQGRDLTEALEVCALVERAAHVFVTARLLGGVQALPPEVVEVTSARYVEAYELITGRSFTDWPGVER